MAADYKKIHRLLRILTLIQGQTGWTAGKLARECGVGLRTIYRDMSVLESVEIPYFHDPETNGYRVRRDFFMPPVDLTLDEALAVLTLGEHIGGREQIPLARPASRAIAKIRSNLPGKLRAELEDVDRRIVLMLARAGPHEGIGDAYEKIRTAMTRRRVLSCSYESVNASLRGGDDGEVFEFRPYALLFSQRAWYVVGHHSGRGAVRTLKLNRITRLVPTAKPYAIPDDFSLEDHLGDAWRMIRGSTTHAVVLEFDRTFADTIADTHWHRTQQVEERADGGVTLRFRVDGLEEIVWWVLSMGPHCVVREPAELAARVRELAAGVVAAYDRSARRTPAARAGG